MLRQAIQGISDLILVPGLINLDFADVKTIMSGMGLAMMGTGTAEGKDRALDAARRAISSPLLEGASVNGARGVIINVTGGPDLSLMEVSDASTIVQEAAHEDANIIFGAVVDPELQGKVKITVIATGFELTPAVAAGCATCRHAGGHVGVHRPAACAARRRTGVGIRFPIARRPPLDAADGSGWRDGAAGDMAPRQDWWQRRATTATRSRWNRARPSTCPRSCAARRDERAAALDGRW